MANNRGESSTSSGSFSTRDSSRGRFLPGGGKTTPGKKKLPEPTHIGHFFIMLIMKVCRMILFVDTSVKIGVYLIGVMVGSVFCDIFVFPKSYFSDKGNILNQFFVKIGWGWTFTFLLVYIFLTSFVYTCGNLSQVRRHLLRLIVGTLGWFVCTKSFLYVESVVGVCSLNEHKDMHACHSAGKSWLGFDISGHTFLLIHCLLMISEEAKTFKEWRKLGAALEEEDIGVKRRLTDSDISQAQASYQSLTPLIKWTIVGLAILTVIWEFMLLVTTIYRFHTLPQKVVAAFIAVGWWFLSYRVLYKNVNPWLPCSPGECQINYMKVL